MVPVGRLEQVWIGRGNLLAGQQEMVQPGTDTDAGGGAKGNYDIGPLGSVGLGLGEETEEDHTNTCWEAQSGTRVGWTNLDVIRG